VILPKEPKDRDLHNMAWLISSLDMAIYGNPVRLDYIERMLRNYEKKYQEIRYDRIMQSLRNIERIMLEKIYTEKMRLRLKLLNYGTRIFLIAAIVVAFISLFYRLNYLLILFYSFFALAVLLLFFNYLILKSMDRRIEGLDDPDYLREKEMIMGVNQYLIDILAKKVKEKNANPDEYRIPLKSEYKNLKIVSRSSFLRKYYTAVVQP
jgi:hypothetical protein